MPLVLKPSKPDVEAFRVLSETPRQTFYYVQSLICLASKPPRPLRSHPKPGSSMF